MICNRVWKTAKYQGKIREKSGNFEVDDKWQSCRGHTCFSCINTCLVQRGSLEYKVLQEYCDGLLPFSHKEDNIGSGICICDS